MLKQVPYLLFELIIPDCTGVSLFAHLHATNTPLGVALVDSAQNINMTVVQLAREITELAVSNNGMFGLQFLQLSSCVHFTHRGRARSGLELLERTSLRLRCLLPFMHVPWQSTLDALMLEFPPTLSP